MYFLCSNNSWGPTSLQSVILHQYFSNSIYRLCDVGGDKEKLIAALNNQITEIFMPILNQEEIEKLDYIYKDKLQINYVSNYQEIYDKLFVPNDK